VLVEGEAVKSCLMLAAQVDGLEVTTVEGLSPESGLNDLQVRDKVATQLYLTNYLDSRFRPSVQVDAAAIENFYNTAVLPRAKARGQEPPTLEASREIIQEALIQESINAQADQWLKESRARIHVQRLLDEGTK